MSEKRLLLDGVSVDYSGFFDLLGLLKLIDKVTAEKGYAKNEKRREETVKESGKEFYLELRPVKRKRDFFVLMIKLRIEVHNLKDIEILKDNIRTMTNEGNVHILLDAWTTTDYEFRWEQKPLFYFLRSMFEHFIYKFHTDEFADELVDDTHYLRDEIKAYLELGRY